ncbi:MAG: hypothetical protein ACM3XP_00310 [Nitrososphaerales archaeon]
MVEQVPNYRRSSAGIELGTTKIKPRKVKDQEQDMLVSLIK